MRIPGIFVGRALLFQTQSELAIAISRRAPVGKGATMGEQADDVPAETMLVPTVAGQVLAAFFDELGKQEDLSDVSANLRKLVMDDGILTEVAIRAVLFPDAP